MTYDDLNKKVREQYLEALYNNGYNAYNQGRYEEAAANLQKVADEEIDYGEGAAAYYLAQAYRRSGRLALARQYFQYVVDNYPGTQRARTAQNYVNAQD